MKLPQIQRPEGSPRRVSTLNEARERTVLIYRDELLPISETFIQAQASALKKYKAQFVGVARSKQSLTLDNKPILVLPRTDTRMESLRRRLYYHTGFAPRFHQALRATGADIIHAHFAPSGKNAAPLAEQLAIPLVITLHGHDVTITQDYQRLYGDLWERTSLFICVSEFIKKKALAAGFPRDKLEVHYIGVDCQLFSSAIENKMDGLVLFVGRLVEKKGCEYLLAAMQDVEKSCPGSHLIVIGDGPLRLKLVQDAHLSNIRCTFLGSVPGVVVRQHLNRATVLCVPSVTATNGDSEGLPTVIMEALAVGTAVVSTTHAGIPEIIETGKSGLLVPERDPKRLAEAVTLLLQNEKMRRSCVKVGRDIVQRKFELNQQTMRLEGLYDDVVRRPTNRN